jgi:hypothetical protein
MDLTISIPPKQKVSVVRIIENSSNLSGDKRRRHSVSSYIVEVHHSNLNLKDNKRNTAELPDITLALVDMGTNFLIKLGYSVDGIKCTFTRYNFKNIEQAIWIMGKDPETGRYNHFFYHPEEKKKEDEDDDSYNRLPLNICLICNDIEKLHHQYIEPFPVDKSMIMDNTQNNLIGNCDFTEYKAENEINIFNKDRKNIEINQELIDQLENEFKNKDLCIICYANEVPQNIAHKLGCNHSFCQDCVKTYVVSKIRDATVKDIKCLQAGCKLLYPEPYIKEIVGDELFNKYLFFKRRSELQYCLQNGYIHCTFANCQELVPYKDGEDSLVECARGHQFCAICKEEWHNSTDCKNVKFY